MKGRGVRAWCSGFVLFSHFFSFLPLNTGQYGSDIVCRTPPILQYIQAQFARVVYVWMKHLTDELDPGRLIRVLLLKMHDQSKSAVFKRRVRRPDDDGVPRTYTQTRSIRKPSILSNLKGAGQRFHCRWSRLGGGGGDAGVKGENVLYTMSLRYRR